MRLVLGIGLLMTSCCLLIGPGDCDVINRKCDVICDEDLSTVSCNVSETKWRGSSTAEPPSGGVVHPEESAAAPPSGCVVELDDLELYLRNVNLTIYELSNVTFNRSEFLLKNPLEVQMVRCSDCRTSWEQIYELLRHVRFTPGFSPSVGSDDDILEDLKDTHPEALNYKPCGLHLLSWLPREDDVTGEFHQQTMTSPGDSHQPNMTSSGMETMMCLTMTSSTSDSSLAQSFSNILHNYNWSSLEYLELNIHFLNLSEVVDLAASMPKLKYLKFHLPVGAIPDAVWNFDWNSLFYKTAFVYRPGDQDNEKVDLRGKIKWNSPPYIAILIRNVFYYKPPLDHPPLLCITKSFCQVDMGHNELTSLGNFVFVFTGEEFHLDIDLSHNNLTNKNLHIFERFISSKSAVSGNSDVKLVVQNLDLSFNQLEEGWSDFMRFQNIKQIHLHHNKFKYLPYSLIDSDRTIYSITDLNELQILDLSHNSILELANDKQQAFLCKINLMRHGNFSQIREMYFQHNELWSLPDYVYRAKHLTIANFSNNKINFISMWPQNGTILPTISQRKYIYLRENLISELDLSLLTQSQINDLHNVLENFEFDLDGNPINCSCKTHRMFKYLISHSRSETLNMDPDDLQDFSFYKNQWKCMTPSHWAGIPLMKIPEIEYDQMCLDSLQNCPEDCSCYHSWKLNGDIVATCNNLEQLPSNLPVPTSRLLLSGNKINRLCETHSYLSSLKHLELSSNSIKEICEHFLLSLNNLTELYLENSEIEVLPPGIEKLTNLRTLVISNNRLKELPKSVQNMEHLKMLDISGNIWRCDCDTYWMTGWLIKSFHLVSNPRGLLCFSGQGSGKRIMDLTKEEMGCNKPLYHGLTGLAVTVVVVGVLGLLIYRYRGYIKIWIYTRFGFHPWDQVQENPEEKDYDAFVSYCREDVDWVLKTLLPYLEAPQCGFHLCVHERDFVPGAAITKNITTAIQYSRRTILVLTPDFIKSGWCDLEFQAAHQRALEDRSNYLIVVLLKEVPDKDLDETLKLYMKTNTYVSADDKWFWKKMLYAMPKVPIDKLKAEHVSPEAINLPLGIQAHYNAAVMINEHDNINNPELNLDQGGHDDVSHMGDDVALICDDVPVPGDDATYDFTDTGDDVEEVYRRCDRRDMVARLPPLFRRINSYTECSAWRDSKL